jgi:hypothetical protein
VHQSREGTQQIRLWPIKDPIEQLQESRSALWTCSESRAAPTLTGDQGRYFSRACTASMGQRCQADGQQRRAD